MTHGDLGLFILPLVVGLTFAAHGVQEISSDGRLYKESYRDAQLAGLAGVAGGSR
jgi:hypothetical protein